MSLADQVRGWRPAPVTRDDVLDAAPARALAAVLDQPVHASAALPPLWHWLYFLDWPPRSALGEDGHPAEGEFLPPVPDRRRMFAGGRLRVHAPLRTGSPATRVSEVAGVAAKTGASGELLFVTVRSTYRQDGALSLVEEQDLVYRSGPPASPPAAPGKTTRWEAPTSSPPTPGKTTQPEIPVSPPPTPEKTAQPEAPASPPPLLGKTTQPEAPASAPPALGKSARPDGGGPWRMEVTADPPLLFRFSALTANTHRIHYDQDYARKVEGYPGLVVHGPLLAVLMAELPRRHAPAREVTAMTYRFRRPVFAGEPMLVTGDPATGALKVLDASGATRADATVTFADSPTTR